jgi:hypothetical protein
VPAEHAAIDPAIAAEIESCSYLYLRELREPKDNTVTLILDEAIVASNSTSIAIGNATFNNLRNIEITRNSRAFELSWERYAAYSIRNESFALPTDEEEEVISGRWLRVYRKSHWLDYLAKATWRDRPVIHFGIMCLNHIIDVASVDPPKIRLL